MRNKPASSAPVTAEAPSPRRLTPVGLLIVLLVGYLFLKAWPIVVLAVLAVLYATVIERPVSALGRKGIPRQVAILLIDAILVAGIVLPVLIVAPIAGKELDRVREEEPAKLRELDVKWQGSSNPLLHDLGSPVVERAISLLESPSRTPAPAIADAATRALKTVIAGLACLVMAYYYLLEKEFVRGMLLENLQPSSRVRVERTWDGVEQAIGGWMRSRLLLGLIVGVVSAPVFGLMGLPYWPLLGLLAGLTEPIPILGPWIGGVPAVFLALTISPMLALVVIVFILARQGVVDAVLVPRITEETVGLSPLTVFVAVLVGTELIGPAGALLAIPVAAAIQIVVAEWLTARREAGRPIPSPWSWLRGGQSG